MNNIPEIRIGDSLIGSSHPTFVVAEMSGNHNGDINRAIQLVIAAKKAGADAVKLQTYRADTITINHSGPEFVLDTGLWKGRALYELYEEAHTPWEWHQELFELGKELGMIVFSSPFDHSAVDFLEDLNCPAYKIASPEIIDIPLIRKAAATGKPLIISTGMATSDEISEAITAARDEGLEDLVILHCTSSYPAAISDANLSTIPEIRNRFKVQTGLSDHTPGILTSILAVSLGACLIEKHFTLNRADGGVDSAFSLEASELENLVKEVKSADTALGTPTFTLLESEKMVFKNRRSLYATSDLAAGEQFTENNVRSIRPGYGLKPKFLPDILGTKTTRAIKFGEPIDESMILGGLPSDV